MEPDSIFITASTAATFFYIVGGALVVAALAISLVGMRRDDFPSTPVFRALLGLVALIVLATGTGAVLSARDEQEERRENQEAAQEAETETETNVEAEATERESEAAEPGAGPNASAPGGAKVDAAKLFVDTGCGSCHTLADAGTDGQVGPVLDEVLPGQDPEAIRTSIVDPGAKISEGFPAGVMPTNFGETLTAKQLDALANYLASVAGQ
jgi:mono/diheme cytochrome c family protein